MKKTKYPRTPHLSYSIFRSPDDIGFLGSFEGYAVVVTEKLDGETATMSRDYIHARSLDSRHHESRAWVKNLHASIAHLIPDNMRICGENVYAKHSIFYNKLTSYFYVFAIFENDICLSWNDTVQWAELLELQTVPVLYDGLYNEARVKQCFSGKSLYGEAQEGFVVRNKEAFHQNEFALNVAKFVGRKVSTNKHWMFKEVVPNQLGVWK